MKRNILFIFIVIILTLGLSGCKSKEANDKKTYDDTKINDSADKSNNNDIINSSDDEKNSSTYDYIVYCDIGKRVGRKALYGTGSYGEYYIKNSSVVGLKTYIVTPKTLTDSELEDVIKELKEDYGDEGTTIDSNNSNITVIGNEKNSVVSSLTIEDINKMLDDSKYYCYKK